MSPTPDFVLALRERIGHELLWMPGVTAVVVRGDEVLLTRRADTGAWAPITGILDPGEEPAAGAAREALEECGVAIRVERLAGVRCTDVRTYPNGDRAVYLDLAFACTWVSGEARVADDENLEVAWWPLSALPPMDADHRERVDAATSGEQAARFLV